MVRSSRSLEDLESANAASYQRRAAPRREAVVDRVTGALPATPPLDCRRFECARDIAAEWDAFVPADRPHLRSGFLAAAVDGAVVAEPLYLMVYNGDRLMAVAFAYTLEPDLLGVVPVWLRKLLRFFIPAVRRGWRPSLRVCGPPLWNGASGICLAPDLEAHERRAVVREIEGRVATSARDDQVVFVREFNDDEVKNYAGELEALGYFAAELLPGMQLPIEWASQDEYLATLRSSYRRHFRRDLRAGDALQWELRETFDDLAAVAAELFDNVHLRAEFRFERLTPEFFQAVSGFGPSRLLVAREPVSGKVVGVNLLLFAEGYVQFTYIGMNYDYIDPYRLYFNLFERSLIEAIRHGATRCTLGADSYSFKTRLGAQPYRLTGYLRHPRAWVRFVLRKAWRWMFDDIEVLDRKVFGELASWRVGE
jgi:hypothetical protein